MPAPPWRLGIPLRPSTSVVDAFDKYCRRLRIDPGTGKKNYAIIQAEDELSALGMVIGANWNGARAFTATSGPGMSLMSEFLGLAYFAEIPTVLIDVQRAGPSTGMPTRTQQSDVLMAAYASHGDTKHVLLFPATPAECFSMTVEAFDLAERLQTPILIMSDLDLGMNEWMSPPLEFDDNYRYDRGKCLAQMIWMRWKSALVVIRMSMVTAYLTGLIPACIRTKALTSLGDRHGMSTPPIQRMALNMCAIWIDCSENLNRQRRLSLSRK